MITYAQESYDKVYSAKIVSISTCICLFVYLLILVIPFVLVYASNSNPFHNKKRFLDNSTQSNGIA